MRHLHSSDIDFLEAFRDDVGEASPVNAIGVLSRADELAGGRLDGMTSAAQVAARYRKDPKIRRLCQTVVPVAGLLAQAGVTLTEEAYRVTRGDRPRVARPRGRAAAHRRPLPLCGHRDSCDSRGTRGAPRVVRPVRRSPRNETRPRRRGAHRHRARTGARREQRRGRTASDPRVRLLGPSGRPQGAIRAPCAASGVANSRPRRRRRRRARGRTHHGGRARVRGDEPPRRVPERRRRRSGTTSSRMPSGSSVPRGSR